MRRLLCAAGMVGALMTLSACDTTSPMAQYTPSTPNVLAFQSALKSSGRTVQVGDFSQDGSIAPPSCRLAGRLDVTSGKPIDQYIKDALQTELFTAGVYDVNSPVKISGRLDQLKVNTFGTGSWTIGMQVTSNVDPTGYHVQATRTFASSYSAISACRNATSAFAPTVSDLLAQIVQNPEFGRLAGEMETPPASVPDQSSHVVRP